MADAVREEAAIKQAATVKEQRLEADLVAAQEAAQQAAAKAAEEEKAREVAAVQHRCYPPLTLHLTLPLSLSAHCAPLAHSQKMRKVNAEFAFKEQQVAEQWRLMNEHEVEKLRQRLVEAQTREVERVEKKYDLQVKSLQQQA